jgi:hypothetical protein
MAMGERQPVRRTQEMKAELKAKVERNNRAGLGILNMNPSP